MRVLWHVRVGLEASTIKFLRLLKGLSEQRKENIVGGKMDAEELSSFLCEQMWSG